MILVCWSNMATEEEATKFLFTTSQKKSRSETRLQLLNAIFNLSHSISTLNALSVHSNNFTQTSQIYIKKLVLTNKTLQTAVLKEFPDYNYNTIWKSMACWWANLICHKKNLRAFFKVIKINLLIDRQKEWITDWLAGVLAGVLARIIDGWSWHLNLT